MNKIEFKTTYTSISQIRRFAVHTIEISNNGELTYLLFQIGNLATQARQLLQQIDENSMI